MIYIFISIHVSVNNFIYYIFKYMINNKNGDN